MISIQAKIRLPEPVSFLFFFQCILKMQGNLEGERGKRKLNGFRKFLRNRKSKVEN